MIQSKNYIRKIILASLAFCGAFSTLLAQERDDDDDDGYGIMASSDLMTPPEFPDGVKALAKFFDDNLYCTFENDSNKTFNVIVRFNINSEGYVREPKILQGTNNTECDNEVIRTVKLMPQWIPGKRDGKNISTLYTLPIVVKARKPIQESMQVDMVKIAERIEDGTLVYVRPNKRPEFTGGNDALAKFIDDNLEYPEDAIKKNTQGVVGIQLVIDETGVLKNRYTIISHLSPECDEEALRIVNLMPQWTPAVYEGENVAAYYNLGIRFKLKKKEEQTNKQQ